MRRSLDGNYGKNLLQIGAASTRLLSKNCSRRILFGFGWSRNKCHVQAPRSPSAKGFASIYFKYKVSPGPLQLHILAPF